MNPSRYGYFISIVSAVLYGLMPLLTKNVYAGGSNAYTVAFLRMVIGALVFYAIFRKTSTESIQVTKKEMKQLILCSLGYGLTPPLLYASYNYLPSGLATTIHFVYPVFVVLGSAVMGIEPLTKKSILCCLLCVAGIALFYTPGGSVSLTGILIALASGLLFAFYTVYQSATDLLEMDPYKLSFWKHLISVVIIGVIALVMKKFVWPGTASAWTFMLLLGLLTASASFLYQQGAKLVGPQAVSILSTFEPLTSVLVGCLVYSEQLTARSIAGILCILASVTLLSLGERKPVSSKTDS